MKKFVLLLLLFTCIFSQAGEEKKPLLVEKIYDVSDLTLEGWAPPPAQKKKSAVKGQFTSGLGTPSITHVIDMLKNRVEPAHWDDSLGTKETVQPKSRIAVLQTAAIHKKMSEFLMGLRQAAAAPPGSMTPMKSFVTEGKPGIEIRAYSLPHHTVIEKDTVATDVPAVKWDDPAFYFDPFATKNGVLVIINQTKEAHAALKPYFSKMR